MNNVLDIVSPWDDLNVNSLDLASVIAVVLIAIVFAFLIVFSIIKLKKLKAKDDE